MIWLAALVASAAPAAEVIPFEGTAKIEVAPIWERTERRSFRVELEPTGDAKWRVTYRRGEYVCALDGTGPREAITLVPKQACRVPFDDGSMRGTIVARVVRGSLKQDDKGVDHLELHASLAAEDAEKHVVIDRFVTIDRWVPMGSPRGTGSFVGKRRVEPE